MASNLGTVFVELSLDDKVYKQKLGETLTSTQTTAKGIETSWKALGSKSEALFNQQRLAAENAYTLIKNSAKSTANDIVRAEEAKNQKIKALNEQQFGHHDGLIAKMKKNWLAATAAVTAAYFALSKAWDLAEKAANFEQQKVGFANLAASYGSNGEKILESLKKVSDGTVNSMTLVNKAGTAMMMGIDPEKIVKLMEIARATTRVTGQSVTQAFDDISLAVARSSKLKLDNLGIIIDVAKANEEYARELGTTSDKLNDTQKKQAFLNESIKMGEDLIKRMGDQADTTRDKMDRLKVSLDELQLLMGQGLIRAGLGLYGVFQMVAAAALKISQGIFKIAEGANALLDFVTFDNSPGGAKAKEDKKYWSLQSEAAGGAAGDLWGKAKDNFAAMTASSKELASVMAKQTVQGTAAPGAVEKAIAQAARLKEEERLLDAKYKHELTIAKATSDAEEQMRKDAEVGAKTSAAGITRLTKERGDAARELYKDMKGYEQEFYDESVKLIYDQVAKFREAGLDEIAIDKWIKEQKRKAQLQSDRTKPEGSFGEGWNQGMTDWSNEVGNSFKQAEKMAKDTATAMSGSFSDLFFDAFTGEMKSFEDYWKGFTNAVLRSFSDMLAQMLTKWIMNFELMKAIEVAGQAASDVWGAIIKVAGSVAAVAHEGGVVGETSFPSRMMPAYAFANAPRLHNGFMPDEFPAILQRGEAVIPKNQVASSNSRQEEKAQPQVNNIVINAVDAKSFADMCNRNPNAIIAPILAGMKNNKIRSDMKGLLR